MPELLTKEELADAWEYVLTHKKHSEGMTSLLHTTIDALRGKPASERQKAIDTWMHVLSHEKLSPEMMKRIELSAAYLEQSKG